MDASASTDVPHLPSLVELLPDSAAEEPLRAVLKPSDLAFPCPTRNDFPSAGTDDVFSPDAESSDFFDPLAAGTSAPISSSIPVVDIQPMVVTPSPSKELVQPELGFPNDLGAALPDESLKTGLRETTLIAKLDRNLRLPSFDSLGIGNPHPDRYSANNTQQLPSVGVGPLSKPGDPLHMMSPDVNKLQETVDFTHHNARRPNQLICVDTPPEEIGHINWGAFNIRAVAVDMPAPSYSRSQLGQPTPAEQENNGDALGSESQMDQGFDRSEMAWLEDVIDSIVSSIDSNSGPNQTIKILSHALPCPSIKGHAFPEVISAIHERIAAASTTWLNVFHAVPGNFNIDNLPHSPLSTPGPAIGGEDYFSMKVFDSAVKIGDYQGDAQLVRRSPGSVHPIVAPGSVHVSIVERYIPPTSPREFENLFTISNATPSLLKDRLMELSSNNGSLIFIYPTKTGGKRFMKEYLGPILDPLLRSITIVNDLSADLGVALGDLSTAEYLPEFSASKVRFDSYCARLSKSEKLLEAMHCPGASFDLVYAQQHEVTFDREVWTKEWWCKQEKTKIGAAVTKCFKKARRIAPEQDVSPNHVVQEILEGVGAERGYNEGRAPMKGIEVGVFVLRKSLR